jgi:hypothetical protein
MLDVRGGIGEEVIAMAPQGADHHDVLFRAE